MTNKPAYELVNIQGYALPDGAVATMDEVVSISDKPRFIQEVIMIQTALSVDESERGVIGPLTRKRVMDVVQTLTIPFVAETEKPIHGEIERASCGHEWSSNDWPSEVCPICALTGLLMSIRSKIISPATDVHARTLLKGLIKDLEELP